MHIEYINESVKKIFSDFAYMQKKIGVELTKGVKKRVDSLKAANNFYIFLSTGLGKPHRLEGGKSNSYGVHVTANYRLIVMPNSEDFSAESLKKCDTITIKGVEDYHGTKSNFII